MVEVINQIKVAEENAEELRKTCRRTVAQMKEDAAAKGKQLLEERTRRAAQESAAIVERAEAEAAASLGQAREKSQVICDELTASAKKRTGTAADFIAERIVGSL